MHERVLVRYGSEGAKGGENQPQYGTGFWAKHSIAPASPVWRGAWLEWGLRRDFGRLDMRRAYAFVAGVSFHKNTDVAGAPEHADWLAARLDQGFEHVQHQLPRLWSYRYPEQLLVAPTFEEQAELLAKWVLERFESLVRHPPIVGVGRVPEGPEIGAAA